MSLLTHWWHLVSDIALTFSFNWFILGDASGSLCVLCLLNRSNPDILMCIQISGILDSTTHERFALSKSSEHLTRLSQLCHSWTCSVTCTTSLRGIKISEMAQFCLENLAILLPWWTTLNLAKSFLVTTPTTSLLSLHTSMCRWKKICINLWNW